MRPNYFSIFSWSMTGPWGYITSSRCRCREAKQLSRAQLWFLIYALHTIVSMSQCSMRKVPTSHMLVWQYSVDIWQHCHMNTHSHALVWFRKVDKWKVHVGGNYTVHAELTQKARVFSFNAPVVFYLCFKLRIFIFSHNRKLVLTRHALVIFHRHTFPTHLKMLCIFECLIER